MSRESPASILYDNTGNPIGVSQDGILYRLRVESRDVPSTNATRISIANTISDTLLLAANNSRLGLLIYNDSDSPLYVGFGTTPVTTEDFTLIIGAHSLHVCIREYVGQIRGLWQTASGGDAHLTELT